jgi:hypothetical protein
VRKRLSHSATLSALNTSRCTCGTASSCCCMSVIGGRAACMVQLLASWTRRVSGVGRLTCSAQDLGIVAIAVLTRPPPSTRLLGEEKMHTAAGTTSVFLSATCQESKIQGTTVQVYASLVQSTVQIIGQREFRTRRLPFQSTRRFLAKIVLLLRRSFAVRDIEPLAPFLGRLKMSTRPSLAPKATVRGGAGAGGGRSGETGVQAMLTKSVTVQDKE